MKCKLSDKCEFGNLCKDATRHDSLTVLGCSSFKTKKPMTNEEWMKVASVREAIGYFCYKVLGSDGCKACRLNTKEKCRLNEWLKEIHE